MRESMTFQALTLWQPWASLLIGGCKRFETRGWAPKATRFWCAIHAAAKAPATSIPESFIPAGFVDAAAECLHGMGYECMAELPLGSMIGLVLWETIRPTTELLKHANEKDILFGDWSAGRYAWKVNKIFRFAEPVPATGRQRLWRWEIPAALHAEWMELAE